MKSRVPPPRILLSYDEFCKQFSELSSSLPDFVRLGSDPEDRVLISLEGKKIIVDFFKSPKK